MLALLSIAGGCTDGERELAAPTTSNSGAGGSSTGSTTTSAASTGNTTNTVSSASTTGASTTSTSTTSTSTTGTSTTGGSVGPAFELYGAPLLFSPTAQGFGLSAVLRAGDPARLEASVREEGEETWGKLQAAEARAADLAQWQFEGLKAGTRYEYQIVAPAEEGSEDETQVLYEGQLTTARPEGEAFSFALLTDSHIGAYLEFGNQGDETKLAAIGAEIGAVSPDFMVNLGDLLDFHQYAFNGPPPSGEIARLAYLNYRSSLGDSIGRVPHYTVIGNWEGENGDHSAEAIMWSREQRMLYMPGPKPSTYPQGGSPFEDYYAFTWGDALFVVLNVMTYTPTSHLLGAYPGLPDDWTLGEEQLAWLTSTLENATSKWRFLMIHHAVGGAAGNDVDSAYGRGGGQAAQVGEQAVVHQLMLDHGVQIFFYGHDHVFTDMVVDGIHYTLPGRAGAIWAFDTEYTGYTTYWTDFGWAQVDVSPESVDVKFLAIGGNVLYEYSIQ